MKNLIFYLFFIGMIAGLNACKEYGEFSYTKTKSIPINYNINVIGDFNEKGLKYGDDLKQLFDLPRFAKVDKIVVNGMTVNLENLPGSDADFLDIEANLEVYAFDRPGSATSGSTLIKKAKHKNVPIGYLDVNKFLDEKGLAAIRKFIQESANPLATKYDSYISVAVKGNAHSVLGNPQKINAKLTANINATIIYRVCENVGINIFGGQCPN
jgi:hypothetical protein